jgi:hypothetical protein
MTKGCRSLAELIACRREILEWGDGWKGLCDLGTERMMRALEKVEREIVAYPCASKDDNLRLLSILLDSDDAPGFADDFKNSLFFQLRGFEFKTSSIGCRSIASRSL